MKTNLALVSVLLAGHTLQLLAQPAGTFTATGATTTSRDGHTATLLNNGKVLIAGGDEAGFNPLATAELYDPISGTFSRTGDMTAPRWGHSASLLPDGRVLIAGGCCTPQADIPTNTAEIYDPSTGTFAATGNMIYGHVCQQANLLVDGRVLIVGGSGFSNLVPNAELYDPAGGTFAPAGAYASDTSGFNSCQGGVSTVLSDGKVLIVWESARAEIFDPAAGSFTATANLSSTQDFNDGLPTATLLLNGKVLLAGGGDDSGTHANAELYDASTGAFTAAGAMTTGRDEQTATLLPDGTVLMAGSSLYGPGGVTLASTELYDPAGDVFTPSGDMTAPRGAGHTATLLTDGRVLIAGANINYSGALVRSAPIGAGTSRAYERRAPNPQTIAAAKIREPALTLMRSSFAELYNPPVFAPPPALFSLSGDGQGQGAIWHATTGQIASPEIPAIAGEILSMYAKGLVDGAAIPPQVAVGGRLTEVLYFGDVPGYPGYHQVNFRAPDGVTSGSGVSVRLTYLGRPSNEVTIGVQ